MVPLVHGEWSEVKTLVAVRILDFPLSVRPCAPLYRRESKFAAKTSPAAMFTIPAAMPRVSSPGQAR